MMQSSPTTRPATAFLGLGLMGRPMARRLAGGGVPLTVWNRSKLDLDDLTGLGATVAGGAAEAAAGAEVVCLCLSDAAAVDSVVFGPGGVAGACAPGTLLVDFSSLGATRTRALAARFAQESGGRWIDAPVSGGVAGAEAGSLIIFCGGDAADVDAVRPILELVSSRASLMGGVGAGQATKSCNQLIVSAAVMAIAEAVALGRALDVDVARLPDVLKGGFADSAPLQIFGRRMVADDPGPPVGHISTLLKDVAAAEAEAEAAGASLPLLGDLNRLYARAVAQGLGGSDLSALATARL
jgi:3-hydroxyisobutyrate dehydrogenase-like beta-hydroxyacid dehydrogenase